MRVEHSGGGELARRLRTGKGYLCAGVRCALRALQILMKDTASLISMLNIQCKTSNVLPQHHNPFAIPDDGFISVLALPCELFRHRLHNIISTAKETQVHNDLELHSSVFAIRTLLLRLFSLYPLRNWYVTSSPLSRLECHSLLEWYTTARAASCINICGNLMHDNWDFNFNNFNLPCPARTLTLQHILLVYISLPLAYISPSSLFISLSQSFLPFYCAFIPPECKCQLQCSISIYMAYPLPYPPNAPTQHAISLLSSRYLGIHRSSCTDSAISLPDAPIRAYPSPIPHPPPPPPPSFNVSYSISSPPQLQVVNSISTDGYV